MTYIIGGIAWIALAILSAGLIAGASERRQWRGEKSSQTSG